MTSANNILTGRGAGLALGRDRHPILFAALGVFVISVTAHLFAEEEKPADSGKTPAAAKPSEKAKVEKLFDGKTLAGWKKSKFFSPGEVEVKDGAVILKQGSSMTGITSTRKDLPTTNYELRFEARRVDGFDFFAAVTFPVGKSHASFLNGGWGGSVTGISSIDGFDASENSTGTYFEYKDKQWYKFRIRVTDEKIQCWVDKQKVVDVDIKGREIDTRIEVDESKPLGFASWETTGEVKNIQLQRLTPEEVAETNKPAE